MLKFRFERILLDLLFTSLLAALLAFFFMLILDLVITIEVIKDLFPLIGWLVMAIVFLHLIFCLSNDFFWKFGFLLPDELYYYIFVKNKSDLSKYLIINLDASELILSRPNWDHKNKLKIEIDKSCTNEAQRIVLWLRKIGDNILTIENRDCFEIIESQGSNCGWKDAPHSIYFVIYNNIILLLVRSLLLLSLFTLILLQNPPIMIAVDPTQIQENLSQGEERIITISTENIGCNLYDVKLDTRFFNESLVNAAWMRSNLNVSGSFPSNNVDFVRLKVDENSPAGEYRGSIKITGYANRTIIPDLHYLGLLDLPFIETPITVPTYTKKLAEVPFLFRINSKLDATAYCANGKLKHENFHLSSSRR
ncbi:MAG: hypothetical protein WAW52_04100 [Methanothrix sp.]